MNDLTHCPHCHKALFPDLPEWAERVRAIRKSRRLSQQQLAAELGVTISAVQKYEYGTTQPSENVRAKIEAMEESQ